MVLTPEAWHLALEQALNDYKAALEKWKAERTPEAERLLRLAADHVEHIEAQWPGDGPSGGGSAPAAT